MSNIPVKNKQIVHHWLIYQCNPTFETDYLSTNPFPQAGNCFDYSFTNSQNPPNTYMNIQSQCRQISLLWSMGGDLEFYYPSGTAYPIGGSDREFTYFFLEIHYDNPTRASGF